MNMDGRGKRKRDQVVQCDVHSKDTDDSDGTRNKKIETDRAACKTISRTERHRIEKHSRAVGRRTLATWTAKRHSIHGMTVLQSYVVPPPN